MSEFDDLRTKAIREPLGTDISDYGDEWCAGFLAGQANALDELWRLGFVVMPPAGNETIPTAVGNYPPRLTLPNNAGANP